MEETAEERKKRLRRDQTRRYRAAHPEKVAALGVRWRANNSEVRAKYARLYRERHPDKVAAANAEWRANNPEKVRELRQCSHARRRAAVNGTVARRVTAKEWRGIKEYFGHRCAYCLQPAAQLEQEHMQPLAHGGQHTVDNVIPACRHCNRTKHAKGLAQWLLYLAV